MTKEQILQGLKAGKALIVDRKDEPLLPWLLSHPFIANTGIVQADEQYSYIRFWWKEFKQVVLDAAKETHGKGD